MPTRQYRPTLQIEGDEVPVSRFSFSSPAGSLGVLADIGIADSALSFNRGDVLTLTLRHETGTTPKTRLIKNGRVAGDNKSTGLTRVGGTQAPGDSYSLKAVDQIGEKHKLAPRIPIILFDPQHTVLEDNETDTNVNDENGDRIVATAIPVNDLDLEYILNFAYVEKCGFDEVITNLPNYRIPRADFSLNSSYHNIAKAFYGSQLFNPLFFEDDNRFFIIDVFGEIPEGMLTGARQVQTDGYINYTRQNPDVAVVNAVLLSHKEVSVQTLDEDSFPLDVTQRVDEDPPNDVGTPGAIGWQRTILRRHVAEIHDDENDPGRITSEIVWRTETRTSIRGNDGIVREVEINIQTEFYTNSWRLKVGWRRDVTIYAGNGSGTKLMQLAETENGQIIWRPSIRRPGEYEKVRMLSQLEGLVLVEGDEEEDPENVVKTPLRDAERAGSIPDDDSATIERMPISTVTQVWRDTGADQIQVLLTKIDHLTNTPEGSGTTEHVGTNSVRVRTGDAINTRQVLIVDEDSDIADGAREPISFDAGYLEFSVAQELAIRALEQARNPRQTISCELASFDGGIRRGSIRRIQDREGNEVTAIITGYTVTGTPQGRGLITISQSIEGAVIA
jgi:hypothetical protein